MDFLTGCEALKRSRIPPRRSSLLSYELLPNGLSQKSNQLGHRNLTKMRFFQSSLQALSASMLTNLHRRNRFTVDRVYKRNPFIVQGHTPKRWWLRHLILASASHLWKPLNITRDYFAYNSRPCDESKSQRSTSMNLESQWSHARN